MRAGAKGNINIATTSFVMWACEVFMAALHDDDAKTSDLNFTESDWLEN